MSDRDREGTLYSERYLGEIAAAAESIAFSLEKVVTHLDFLVGKVRQEDEEREALRARARL